MCRSGKLFYLLLAAFLFLFSASSWGDVTLTDQEFQELMSLQTQQEKSLISQSETIKSLETELNGAKNLQEMQNETINLLLTQIDVLKKSSKMPNLGVEFGTTYNLNDGPGLYGGVNLDF